MASSLSLNWGILFGEFQCLPVNDCSAVNCDSGALSRGSEYLVLIILFKSFSCLLKNALTDLKNCVKLWLLI